MHTSRIPLVAVAMLMAPSISVGAQDASPQRVAVTGCAVMFAMQSSGSSATRAGLIAEKGRSDVKVTNVYKLTGPDSAMMQSVTDRLCAATEQQLATQGYQVVTTEFEAHANYAEFQKKGAKSGKELKNEGTRYVVLAPTGKALTVPELAGGMAAGGLPVLESGMLSSLKAGALRAFYVVDFADINAKNVKGNLRSQNTASVTADVQLSVDATLTMYSTAGFKCWERFGKSECNPADVRKAARTFATAEPKTFADVVTSVEDVSSKAGKAALGALNAVALVAGSQRSKFTEYEVTVDQARYVSRAEEGAMAALTEGVATLAKPPAGKKK